MIPPVTTEVRSPLNRERVLEAAVALADEGGIEALTMRRLAESLGVEAMSLYYHVANKERVLDGIVEAVMAELNAEVDRTDLPPDWKAGLRARILIARRIMLRHRWAPGVIETRTSMNPEILGYYDAIVGHFLAGGFSTDLTHHALHVLGSRAIGFTQELFEPDDQPPGDDDMEMMELMAQQLPNLSAMLAGVTHDPADSTIGWCDDQTEFEFSLDLILDGLERLRS